MSDPAEATPWLQYTIEEQTLMKALVGGQNAQVRLNGEIDGYKFFPDPKDLTTVEWFLKLDLGQTTVSPGSQNWEQDDKRGYFTHAIEVKAGFYDDPSFRFKWDTPDTTAEGGSASRSESVSYNVGFFSASPTGSLGGSITSGSGVTYPDFEIVNSSGTNNEFVHQTFHLRVVGDGKYRIPPDAVEPAYGLQGRVLPPPPRALSNFNIPTKALFHAKAPKLGKTSTLTVEVIHHLVTVEKTWATALWIPTTADKIPWRPKYDPAITTPQRQSVTIFGGSVLIDSIPATNAATYKFDVDMTKGTVTRHG